MSDRQLCTISPDKREEGENARRNNQNFGGRRILLHSKFSPLRKLVHSILTSNKNSNNLYYNATSMINESIERPLYTWNIINQINESDTFIHFSNDDIIDQNDEEKGRRRRNKLFYYINPKTWFKSKKEYLRKTSSTKEDPTCTNSNSIISSSHNEENLSLKLLSYGCLNVEGKKSSNPGIRTLSLPSELGIKSLIGGGKYLHDDNNVKNNDDNEVFPKVPGYLVLNRIAYGGFSTVYKAKHLLTSVNVAIKHVDLTKMASDEMKYVNDERPFPEKYEKEIKMFKSEKSILQRVNHKHIVKLLQIIEDNTLHSFSFITELCDGLDLFDEILKNGSFNYNDTRHIFSQFISGLHYLHTHNIAHLDLKPENVIVSIDGTVKIIDFGMALQFFRADTGMAAFGDLEVDEVINDLNRHKIKINRGCGTLKYMGPEILRCEPFNPFQADIWAAGLILYVMIQGSFLFDGNAKDDVLDEIKRKFEDIRAKSSSPRFVKNRVNEKVDASLLCHNRYPIATTTGMMKIRKNSKNLYFTIYPDIDDLLLNMLRIHPYRRWNTDNIITKVSFIIKDEKTCQEIERRRNRMRRCNRKSFCGLMGQLRTMSSVEDDIDEEEIQFDHNRLKQMKALGYSLESTKESIKNNLFDNAHSVYNILGAQQQKEVT
uniref:Protein kinase domain-containing protein n=1 Tax=Parastrongyloides trichosuri TaxID=131310 RepID=A0A0N4ZZF9_PARTI